MDNNFDPDAYLSEKSSSGDRKSTRLNSSHTVSSYAVFCLKKKRCPRKLPKWHTQASSIHLLKRPYRFISVSTFHSASRGSHLYKYPKLRCSRCARVPAATD